ncbi:hypothetical protein RND59_00735 [Vibrio ruber]|uniref:Uncharacterized protein n=1 Tax=Vibrio rhizosphaerae TaxID=398736 RepID=A0ABU4IU22_9VIBR|nr:MULTISPECIES: hypothetical protein [Vibrio]MDW6092438.1 hypothetical protein [Vibrio rhizosphaerae]WNJ95682.1 hypothetical protein RND59_00735 [Vibrio ruber]
MKSNKNIKLKCFYTDGGQNPNIGQIFQRRKIIEGDRKQVERYQRYLANTLSFIAPTIDDCDLVLLCIEKVENGIEEELEVEGTDVDIVINGLGVQININVNDDWIDQPEGKFELNEVKTAVSGWKLFLGMPEAFDSLVEVEL